MSSAATVSVLITAKDLASRRVKGLAGAFDNLGSRMSHVAGVAGKVTAILGTIGAGFSAKNIAQTGATFEHTMNTVRYVARATEAEFKAMNETAKEMGATTEFSASQAADGLLFLNRAGFGARKSIAALPGVLDLATAGNIGLGRAADIASNVLSAMRLEVEDLSRVNDVMVRTINTANTDMDMMAESMKYAASVAAGYGYEIETVAGLIGILGNNGIQGSMAGTQLAAAFSDAYKVFVKYGVSAKRANGESKDLIDALQLMEEQGTSTQEIMEIFGERAGRAINALIGTGTAQVEAYVASLHDIEGETQRVAQGMRDDLLGDYKTFLSTTESISIAISENNTGFMRSFLQTITETLRENKDRIVEWANAAVRGAWEVFKTALVGLADVWDTLSPVMEQIWATIKRMWDGFRALPQWVQSVGIVGALVGGIKGKILVGAIADLTNSLHTSAQGFDAVREGYISMGDFAWSNHEELDALLRESGYYSDYADVDAPALKGGESSGVAWANGFVGAIEEKLAANEARLKKLQEELASSEDIMDAPPGVLDDGGIADNTAQKMVIAAQVSMAKRAQLELKRFKSLQQTIMASLDRQLEQHKITQDEYYAELRKQAEDSFELEVQKTKEAAQSKAALLRAEAESAKEREEKQELLNRALEIEEEAKVRILELEQERVRKLMDIASQEGAAAEAAKRQAQAKDELLFDMRGNAIAGDDLEAQYQYELDRIERQYQERLRLLDEYNATEEEKKLAQAERVRAITEATAEHEKSVMQHRMQWMQNIVGGMGDLMTQLNQMGLQNSREGFAVYKAFATAEAMVSTYAAAVKAYEQGMTAGGPWGGPALAATYAGIAVATGLAKIALINSAQPQGYAFGGLIGGPDKGARADNVTIRATPGEYMMDRPTVQHYGMGIMEALRSRKVPKGLLAAFSVPALPAASPRLGFAFGGAVGSGDGLSSGGGEGITIVNVTDKSQLDQYLASQSGREIIVNTIRAEGPMIRRMARGEE